MYYIHDMHAKYIYQISSIFIIFLFGIIFLFRMVQRSFQVLVGRLQVMMMLSPVFSHLSSFHMHCEIRNNLPNRTHPE